MIDFESVFCVSPIQIVWGFPPYVLYGQTFVNFQKLTGGGKSTLILYSTTPGHVYRIAHMATPAPKCSCCYTQRKSSGPEGHCDGNFLVLLLGAGQSYSQLFWAMLLKVKLENYNGPADPGQLCA